MTGEPPPPIIGECCRIRIFTQDVFVFTMYSRMANKRESTLSCHRLHYLFLVYLVYLNAFGPPTHLVESRWFSQDFPTERCVQPADSSTTSLTSLTFSDQLSQTCCVSMSYRFPRNVESTELPLGSPSRTLFFLH